MSEGDATKRAIVPVLAFIAEIKADRFSGTRYVPSQFLDKVYHASDYDALQRRLEIVETELLLGKTEMDLAHDTRAQLAAAQERCATLEQIANTHGDNFMKAETRVTALEEALEWVVGAPQRIQMIMRERGFVVEDIDEPYHKFAFTVYTELCAASAKAQAALARDNSPEGGYVLP